jgi:formylglycine-generating enzyme required for sulfatase activity
MQNPVQFFRCSLLLLALSLFGCDNQTKLAPSHDVQTTNTAHCYLPSARGAQFASKSSAAISFGNDTSHTGMVWIKGGTFEMGAPDNKGLPNEYPQHKVTVNGFWMDATEVTNAQFEAFVSATGYVTTAEKPLNWEELKQQLPAGTPKPPDSELQPGAMVFTPTSGPVPMDDISQWWKWVPGANWRHPEGPGSTIKGKEKLPVVQISWEDAMAYCKWAGKRLPTEAEWEWAASSGGKNLYSWGNEEKYNSAANTWQGMFPYLDNKEDGFRGIAPVKSFAANAFGLYEMSGNVWEWCADWYDEAYYQHMDKKGSVNPSGPAAKQGLFLKVIRGGSYLCNPSYCEGYRRSKRMFSSYDSGTNHIGFRCVRSR